MIKYPFVLGVGVGYVLGARAGRNRYEQIVRLARRTKENPAVASAAGAVAHRGEDAFKAAKDKVAEKAPDWVPGATKTDSSPNIGDSAPQANHAPDLRAHPDASVPGMAMPGAAPSHL